MTTNRSLSIGPPVNTRVLTSSNLFLTPQCCFIESCPEGAAQHPTSPGKRSPTRAPQGHCGWQHGAGRELSPAIHLYHRSCHDQTLSFCPCRRPAPPLDLQAPEHVFYCACVFVERLGRCRVSQCACCKERGNWFLSENKQT